MRRYVRSNYCLADEMRMSYWRFALFICMFSAALLGGNTCGAIAAADPESGSPTTADSQTNVGISSTTEAAATAAAIRGSDSNSGSGQGTSVNLPSPMTMAATTTTEHGGQ